LGAGTGWPCTEPRDRRLAPDHVDLVFLHQEADAVIETLGNAARARHYGLGVEARIVGLEAELLGMGDVVEDLGGAQQRLGGDAAPVEADAAEMLALDDGGLEAELGGPDGGDIAAGPGTDDDDVVSVRHLTPTSSPGSRCTA
jgi:hypothetical protein